MSEQEPRNPSRRRFLKLGLVTTGLAVAGGFGVFKAVQNFIEKPEEKTSAELVQEFDIVFNEVRNQKKGLPMQDYSNNDSEAYRFSLNKKIYFFVRHRNGLGIRGVVIDEPESPDEQETQYLIFSYNVPRVILRRPSKMPNQPVQTTEKSLNQSEMGDLSKLLEDILGKLKVKTS